MSTVSYILQPPKVLIKCILLVGVTTYVLVTYIPSTVYRSAPKVPKIIPSVRLCSQTAEFRQIMTNKVLLGAAIATYATVVSFLLFFAFTANNTDYVVSILLIQAIVGAVCGVSFMVSCNWLLKTVDKLKVYKALMILIALLSFFSFFVVLSSTSTAMNVFIVMSTLIAAIGFPVRLFDNIFVRDLVVYDTFLTGWYHF